MSQNFLNESSIFDTARNIADDNAREVYLHDACGGDTEFLDRIRTLLAADNNDGDLLDPTCIKPTNVLVAEYDDHAVPKDIDRYLSRGRV